MDIKEKNIKALNECLGRINNKENGIYFLCYDTGQNARAAVKHIYDMAYTLKQEGYNTFILVENKKYNGVDFWLGDKYSSVPVLSMKDDHPHLKFDDILIIPEYYTHALEQLKDVPANKIMLIQQREYVFETLTLGSRFSDFGVHKIITTTNATKKYLQEYFPESLIYVIPPIIEEIFHESKKPVNPFIALSVRNRVTHKKIISQFYLKYPHLRWFTFRDMVQMTQEEFATNLRDCVVSVWVDDDSTFGTFPLESMKSGVNVIGKIPKSTPDWMGDNGFWVDDEDKIVEILGSYCLSWVDGLEIKDEIKESITTTLAQYDCDVTKHNILSVFESLNFKRKELINNKLEKLK